MTQQDLINRRKELQQEYHRRAVDANWAFSKEAAELNMEISELGREIATYWN